MTVLYGRGVLVLGVMLCTLCLVSIERETSAEHESLPTQYSLSSLPTFMSNVEVERAKENF